MRIYLNFILLSMALFVISRWIPYSQNYPIKLLPISPEATLLLGSAFINIQQSHYNFSTLLKKLPYNFLNVCLFILSYMFTLKAFLFTFSDLKSSSTIGYNLRNSCPFVLLIAMWLAPIIWGQEDVDDFLPISYYHGLFGKQIH